MQLTTRAAACTGLGPFSTPALTVLSMARFGLPTPPVHGTLDNADHDLLHHQYRLSLLQWNPGPTRKNPTQILPAVCGRFHVVILREASDQLRLSQISPFRTLAAQTLIYCSTGTCLSLMLPSLLSMNPPPARHVVGWLHWLFVDCYAALLRSPSALSTFTRRGQMRSEHPQQRRMERRHHKHDRTRRRNT